MRKKTPTNTPEWFLKRVKRHPAFAILALSHHRAQITQLKGAAAQIQDWRTRVHLWGLIRAHQKDAQLAQDFLGGLGCTKDRSWN